MTEEEKEFDPKKRTIALFIIIAVLLIAVLVLEWGFSFFKARL